MQEVVEQENSTALTSIQQDADEGEMVDTEIVKYNPETDPMAQWLALFTSISYSSSNPEASIAARIVSRLKIVKVSDPNVCPMMAVGLQRGRHIMMYNPAWAAKASFTEVVATLVHEAYHVMLRDIPRFLQRMAQYPEKDRGRVHGIINVALDAANNDLIKDRMPHMKYGSTGYWVLPKPLNLPEKETPEVYFEILSQREKEESEEGKGSGGDGDGNGLMSALAQAIQDLLDKNAHDWHGDSDTGDGKEGQPFSAEEMLAVAASLDEEAKRATIGALKDHLKSRGTLPARMQGILDEMLRDAEIPWTTYLRQLVAARVSSKRDKTTKRFNKKRFIHFEQNEEGEFVELLSPLPQFPGIEIERTFVIMWAIDTSGSMSDVDIVDGLSELQGLIKADPNIHVIVVQCDTSISDVSILSPDVPLEKYIENVGRTSYGGTTFDDPFILAQHIAGITETFPVPDALADEVVQTVSDYDAVDMVIYHTDGYAPAPPIEVHPHCPVLWCLTEDGRTPMTYGGGDLFGTVIER